MNNGSQLPDNHPLMMAWLEFQNSDQFGDSSRILSRMLWPTFSAGYWAGYHSAMPSNPATRADAQVTAEEIVDWQRRCDDCGRVTRTLMAEMKASNELLRSAYQIAARNGHETNWGGFAKQLQARLDEQHELMKPWAWEVNNDRD